MLIQSGTPRCVMGGFDFFIVLTFTHYPCPTDSFSGYSKNVNPTRFILLKSNIQFIQQGEPYQINVFIGVLYLESSSQSQAISQFWLQTCNLPII